MMVHSKELTALAASIIVAAVLPVCDSLFTYNDDFWTIGTFAGGGMITDVSIVDLDGDGRNDLIVSQYEDSITSHYVAYSMGDDGLFALPEPLFGIPQTDAGGVDRGGTSYTVKKGIADMDGDGLLDVVACIADNGLFPGMADGLDTAGRLDASGVIILGTNQGNRQFGLSVVLKGNYDFPFPTCQDVAIADVDGDGDVDIVATLGLRTAARGHLLLFENDGTGNFEMKILDNSTLDTSTELTLADFDGDGAPDVAVLDRRRNAIFVYRNEMRAGGSFVMHVVDLGTKSKAITVGSLFTTTGLPDIIGIGRVHDHYKSVALVAYRNKGQMEFEKIVDFEEEKVEEDYMGWIWSANRKDDSAYDAVIYDVDGDGFADVVTCEEWGNVNFYMNLGGETLSTPGIVKEATEYAQTAVAIGDVDGDGLSDLVVAEDRDPEDRVIAYLAEETDANDPHSGDPLGGQEDDASPLASSNAVASPVFTAKLCLNVLCFCLVL